MLRRLHAECWAQCKRFGESDISKPYAITVNQAIRRDATPFWVRF